MKKPSHKVHNAKEHSPHHRYAKHNKLHALGRASMEEIMRREGEKHPGGG